MASDKQRIADLEEQLRQTNPRAQEESETGQSSSREGREREPEIDL